MRSRGPDDNPIPFTIPWITPALESGDDVIATCGQLRYDISHDDDCTDACADRRQICKADAGCPGSGTCSTDQEAECADLETTCNTECVPTLNEVVDPFNPAEPFSYTSQPLTSNGSALKI